MRSAYTGSATILPVATPARARQWLWSDLGRRRGALLATVLVGLGAAASSIAPVYLLGVVVDRVREHDAMGLATLGVVIASTAAVGGIAAGASAYLVNRLGEHLLADLRDDVMAHALAAPATAIEEGGRGDLLSRVGGDAAQIGTAVADVLPTMVNGVLLGVLTLAGIGTMDWRLGLAGALAIPVYAAGLRWYLRRSGTLYADERRAVADHARVTVESLQGRPTMFAYGTHEASVARVAAASERARDLAIAIFRLFTRLVGRVNGAEFVGLAAILIVAFLLVRVDAITVGQTVAAALLFHRLFDPVGMVMYNFDEVQAAAASLARLVGVLDIPTGHPHPGHSAIPAGGAVDVVDVSHRYGPGPVVLQAVSLHIPAGRRLALVGSTGAGKSTLASVVGGLLTPLAGQARIGGVPATALDPRDRVVATITQEVHVFSGSVLDDLRLVAPAASREDARSALRRVGADHWVDELPDGLDTIVGELGHELTIAQAQHLAFARLVLADPVVVILDEATAEAGSSHARELDHAALAATQGRTTLIVAHRLSQAAQADEIVVMERGRVVERGSHDELIAADATYAGFWRAWQTPGA